MKLQSFLNEYEHVELASQEDNKEILSFFSSLDMKQKKSSISYDRSPNFFRYLDLSNSRYYVFLLKDRSRRIKGVGTILVRYAYISGRREQVCYLGDLRISSLKMTVYWRRFYGELMERFSEIDEFKECRLNYTVILDENILAKKTLVESENSFYYSKMATYSMVNIIGPSLLFRTSLKAQFIKESEAPEIELFFAIENTNRAIGFDGEKSLQFRHQNWKGLKEQSLVVKNDSGKILGVCGLWGPEESKRIIVSGLSLGIKTFYKLVRKGKIKPKLTDLFLPLYLTGLTIKSDLSKKEKSDVLKAMIDFTFSSEIFKEYHVLSFADFDNASLIDAYRFCYHQKTPATLYEVSSKKESSNRDLDDYGHSPPGIEIAFI